MVWTHLPGFVQVEDLVCSHASDRASKQTESGGGPPQGFSGLVERSEWADELEKSMLP